MLEELKTHEGELTDEALEAVAGGKCRWWSASKKKIVRYEKKPDGSVRRYVCYNANNKVM
ncbi:MAG: hypothetical protein F6K36_19825 [Symploca sp. SIO3C6]|uniref:Uncharacterized protein n=1 Tax=Symploca sp. SIO1C4 TaxID=2607765 RepID=A0A6B3NCE4_9CYAN|nr:hypothetical protein [Symploca sp. SIO3C6]NER27311.1 hypothetical protein [Symploca sp. SIO1C4]